MQRAKLKFDKFHSVNLNVANIAASGGSVLMGCLCQPLGGAAAGQKTFASAEEASSALFKAAQSNDEKAMLDILGADGKQIVSSGDEAEDAESRANFAEKYQEMHRLVKEAGRDDRPVHRREKLAYADTAGEQERVMVFRHGGWQEGNFVPASWAE